uniref:Uncharacterized protein n=1 Tax=Oryza punctata TaxID=4537 RepID=A0A0E0LTQ8_ORYPU
MGRGSNAVIIILLSVALLSLADPAAGDMTAVLLAGGGKAGAHHGIDEAVRQLLVATKRRGWRMSWRRSSGWMTWVSCTSAYSVAAAKIRKVAYETSRSACRHARNQGSRTSAGVAETRTDAKAATHRPLTGEN